MAEWKTKELYLIVMCLLPHLCKGQPGHEVSANTGSWEKIGSYWIYCTQSNLHCKRLFPWSSSHTVVTLSLHQSSPSTSSMFKEKKPFELKQLKMLEQSGNENFLIPSSILQNKHPFTIGVTLSGHGKNMHGNNVNCNFNSVNWNWMCVFNSFALLFIYYLFLYLFLLLHPLLYLVNISLQSTNPLYQTKIPSWVLQQVHP